MAGMFYTLQEAAEKLNKTEEEIEQIIEEGKLRGFRDGPSVYLKIDEVEAFASEENIPPAPEAPQAEEPATVTTEPEPSPAKDQELSPPEFEQEDIRNFEFDETEVPTEEPEMATVEALAEEKPTMKSTTKEPHAAKPKKAAKKSRPKAQPKIKQIGKPHRMSLGQWLLFSLSDDNPVAIFVLVLFCFAIFSAIAAFAYGLHYLYVNF